MIIAIIQLHQTPRKAVTQTLDMFATRVVFGLAEDPISYDIFEKITRSFTVGVEYAESILKGTIIKCRGKKKSGISLCLHFL